MLEKLFLNCFVLAALHSQFHIWKGFGHTSSDAIFPHCSWLDFRLHTAAPVPLRQAGLLVLGCPQALKYDAIVPGQAVWD